MIERKRIITVIGDLYRRPDKPGEEYGKRLEILIPEVRKLNGIYKIYIVDPQRCLNRESRWRADVSVIDKIEDIAEKVLSGVYEPQAARVAIDAFKWTAGKKLPKKYGERQHIEHGGKIGLADLTNAELTKKLEDLENDE